jgi:hypothetical protein
MFPNQQPQAPAGPPAAQPFPASPPPTPPGAPPPVTIDAVVQLLRDDRMRGFRIDIETDSLVESDQKQERADATELVTAIGGFFKEFGPIVQAMPPLAPLASGLLQFAVRRYKVGAELEELIEKTMGEVANHLANPPPPQPDPTEQVKLQIAQEKAQAEGVKSQANIQATGMKAQAEGQKAQTEVQATQVKAHADQQAAQIDMAGKVLEHQHATAKHHMEMQKLQAEHSVAAQSLNMQASSGQHAHDLKIEQMDHAAKMAKQKPKGDK